MQCNCATAVSHYRLLAPSTRLRYYNSGDAPEWLRPLFNDQKQRRVLLREWEDAEWRVASGWHGNDLIHSVHSRAVQIHAYFWNAQDETLTGIARFGPDAESHRGLCHGGSMTSLMDDLCGHICFFGGPAPWCGATVQVDCKLMKPVAVGDVLKLVGKIDRREFGKNGKQKVHISATLSDESGAEYCHLKGLSISPVPMHTIDDAVAERTWLTEDAKVMRDSGWLLP